MNCIYCHQRLHSFQEINNDLAWIRYHFCFHCLKEYNVDVLYKYSESFDCYSVILINTTEDKWMNQIVVSPLIPCMFLRSANISDIRHTPIINENIVPRALTYYVSGVGWRDIIHPHADTMEFKVMDLPFNSLWLPKSAKDKVKTYLLFS